MGRTSKTCSGSAFLRGVLESRLDLRAFTRFALLSPSCIIFSTTVGSSSSTSASSYVSNTHSNLAGTDPVFLTVTYSRFVVSLRTLPKSMNEWLRSRLGNESSAPRSMESTCGLSS